MSDLLNSIGNLDALTDQTKEASFTKVLPPAGETIGRLVSYVELGPQMFSYQGKETGVAPAVSIGFELLHPVKNMKDGKGQFVTFPIMKLSMNTKARFFKLFTSMRYGRQDIRHMAQLVGEEFKITVEHSACGNYANIAAVSKPYMTDMMSGEEVRLNVPAASREMQMFLWNQPTLECWNSIFIDGEYEKDGSTYSKNFLQNKIKSSPAYPGSSVEAMVGVGVPTGTMTMDDVPF